jgi:hypothetical protein
MNGQLRIPLATLAGALAYARSLGCQVSAARVVVGGALLDVHAASDVTQARLQAAHAAGRLSFEPAALDDALRAVDAAARLLTGAVRGTLCKRRGGRAWCREMDVPVFAVERGKSLALDVELPAGLIREVAVLEAQDALTFAPASPDAVRVALSDVQVGALRWAAGAAGWVVSGDEGYALLVAAAVVRARRGDVRAESKAA